MTNIERFGTLCGIRCIVGLGNPGSRYASSRHNAGFLVADRLISKFNGSGWKRKARGWNAQMKMGERSLTLLKPSTFMNLSGEAVSEFLTEQEIEPAEMIVIHDDLDIDSRQVRIKFGGGHGGHKGVKSIIERIGTPDFYRVRIGIGRPVQDKNTIDFVLSSPQNENEEAAFFQSLDLAVSAVEAVILENLQTAMERYNNKNKQTQMIE